VIISEYIKQIKTDLVGVGIKNGYDVMAHLFYIGIGNEALAKSEDEMRRHAQDQSSAISTIAIQTDKQKAIDQVSKRG
jgi:hypothetical protein